LKTASHALQIVTRIAVLTRCRNLRPALLLALAAGPPPAGAAEPATPGSQVVIVYNSRSAESKSIADLYARLRSVPPDHIVPLDLPTTEAISRSEYNSLLRDPLFQTFTNRGWLQFDRSARTPETTNASASSHLPTTASVRYAVLCRDVPVKIAKDESYHEPDAEKLRPELRRSEAAVDSELSLLPALEAKFPIFGPLSNPVYGTTNISLIHPTNGILIVARLDGPSPQIAQSLVEKALRAETNGLWGRAYFDARGLTNGSYKLGDDWILSAARTAMRFGLETVVDKRPETFSAGFPMSQIALYAGWYDGNVSGPFTRPEVEFMPGAIAYHLHSFSAATIRNPAQNWVGPLLAKGATATFGCVDEPYLEGTPNIAVFCERLLIQGMTFGEAALVSQPALSWQTTVVGDPLYRPFGRDPKELHEQLARNQDPLLAWSHLRVVNLNLVTGMQPSQLIDYLLEPAKSSSVLQEKIGDLSLATAKFPESIEAYEEALKLPCSPNQKLRIQLALSRALSLYQEKEKALGILKQILDALPDYPDRTLLLERMLSLAKASHNDDETKRLQAELDKANAKN